MSANVYTGGYIGALPVVTYGLPGGIWGVGPTGLTYEPYFVGPPDVLTSAAVWLDAADPTTITHVLGAVSQWNNKGVIGGNFTQGTAALQPTTGSTTLNGLNVIDFNNDHLRAATASDWTFMNNGTNWMALAVIKPTSAANGGICGTHDGDWSKVGAAVVMNTTAGNELFGCSVLRGVATTIVVAATSGTGTTTLNNWYIGSLFCDPDNATAANRASVYVNGGSAVANNTYTAAVSTAAPAHPLEIGSTGNGTNDFVGSIAELVILEGADANETNRTAIRNYLNAKWGVY